MRIASLLAPAAVLTLLLAGCDAGSKPGAPADAASATGPRLFISSPKMDQVLEAGKVVEVLFDLRNYEIGKIEDGKNGQHIHLIVDNEPYLAVYDATKAFPLDAKLMTEGTHVVRAFPSAGPKDTKGAVEHESRKNAGAFAWVKFHVGKKGGPLADFDGTKPLLTYSRPKGEYKVGTPNQTRFLIDFYVTNVALGKGDDVVRATLDGTSLGDWTEWKPYFAPTAPAVGEHTIVLELLDRDGKPVPGPFNRTERKFKVVDGK
jgi:hypothetical protein